MSGKPNTKLFKTMTKKHGSEEAAREWYRSIGAKGGSSGHHRKGFYVNRELASRVGKIGGLKLRRGKAKNI